MLALTPFAMLAMASVALRPMMDSRRLMFITPYLLLTLALGVVRLAQRSRWLALALLLILGTFHGMSLAAYRDRSAGPVDFKGFADKLAPHLEANDLIFLHREFYSTPVLYYLKPDHYHLLASHYAEATRGNPNARVWVLLFTREKFPLDMQTALEGYRECETVDFYLARGVLYGRGSCR